MENPKILLPLSVSHAYPVLRSKSHAKLIERGFLPIVVTPAMTNGQLEKAYARADGVLFPGGKDIDPSLYNHPGHTEIGELDPKLDEMQLVIIKKTNNDGKPFLGICRGAQFMAVAHGGTLYPHMPEAFPNEDHGASIDIAGHYSYHDVRITKATIAHEIFKTSHLKNMVSRHHQAIQDPGKLKVTGLSPAGVVEAVENPSLLFQVGLQWHADLPQITQRNTELMNRAYIAFKDAINVYKAEVKLKAA